MSNSFLEEKKLIGTVIWFVTGVHSFKEVIAGHKLKALCHSSHEKKCHERQRAQGLGPQAQSLVFLQRILAQLTGFILSKFHNSFAQFPHLKVRKGY